MIQAARANDKEQNISSTQIPAIKTEAPIKAQVKRTEAKQDPQNSNNPPKPIANWDAFGEW